MSLFVYKGPVFGYTDYVHFVLNIVMGKEMLAERGFTQALPRYNTILRKKVIEFQSELEQGVGARWLLE
jgi:hypothetical protein